MIKKNHLLAGVLMTGAFIVFAAVILSDTNPILTFLSAALLVGICGTGGTAIARDQKRDVLYSYMSFLGIVLIVIGAPTSLV